MKQILALGLIAFLFSSCDNMKHQVKDFSQYFDEYNVDGAFVMYDVNEDKLLPTDDFINGNSEVLKTIAGSIKDFAGDWDAVWNNINLRAKIKQKLVDVSSELNDPEILEAEFVMKANDIFHRSMDKIKSAEGYLDNEKIYTEWEIWLKRALKKRGHSI